jgi:hypothetical protein
MFLKLLPYLLIALGAIGGYVFVTDLQQDNMTMAKTVTELTSDNAALASDIEQAGKDTIRQQTELGSLLLQFDKDQQLARDLTEKAAKDNAQLQNRLAQARRTAQNDTQDDCSFSPMPAHIIGLLFNTDDTKDRGTQRGEDNQVSATSTPNN